MAEVTNAEYIRLWNELAQHRKHIPMLNIKDYPPKESEGESNG